MKIKIIEENRKNAIKRCLKDKIESIMSVNYENFGSATLTTNIIDDIIKNANHNVEQTNDKINIYSDNGLGLGTAYKNERLLVIRTYVSENMLKSLQNESYQFYLNAKKNISRDFKSLKEIDNFRSKMFKKT